MSLFDIIKYPISMPPTEDELVALPTDLFGDWISKTGWGEPTCHKQPVQIAMWYNRHWSNLRILQERNELTLLKQMIKEYEPI